MKRAFNLIRCGIAPENEKKYSNSLKRYRQSIIHVLQFHTYATAQIVIFLPEDINRNITLFIAALSTKCFVDPGYL